jgi:hypothetical protein
MPTQMEGGALRRRRKLRAILNGKNRRIFPTVQVGFRSNIIFLTGTHRRRSLLAKDEAARLIIEAWQRANYWRVGRYVIIARSHSFVLRAKCVPTPTAQELDELLAK